MFLYGKEAMEIARETALTEINSVVFDWDDGSTAEDKVNTITGIMMLLESLGNRFVTKEENNDAT